MVFSKCLKILLLDECISILFKNISKNFSTKSNEDLFSIVLDTAKNFDKKFTKDDTKRVYAIFDFFTMDSTSNASRIIIYSVYHFISKKYNSESMELYRELSRYVQNISVRYKSIIDEYDSRNPKVEVPQLMDNTKGN